MTHGRNAPARPAPSANPREWWYELVGTFGQLFCAFVLVAAIESPLSPLHSALPNPTLRLVLIGLGIGLLAAVVAVSPMGRRSGAHLNPSITAAFWARGSMSGRDALGYMVGQIVGACAAALLFALLLRDWAETAGYARTAPRPGVNLVAGTAIEIGLTFLLVLTVLLMVSSHRTKRWTPVAAMLALAVLVPVGGPPTGASMNFARTLGPDLAALEFTGLGVYLVGPFISAGLAALAHRYLLPVGELVTTRIFHREPPRKEADRRSPG